MSSATTCADVLRYDPRQAFHLDFQVDFRCDAIGTLAVQNSAGYITAPDLHRTAMVMQAMRLARVMMTDEWIKTMIEK